MPQYRFYHHIANESNFELAIAFLSKKANRLKSLHRPKLPYPAQSSSKKGCWQNNMPLCIPIDRHFIVGISLTIMKNDEILVSNVSSTLRCDVLMPGRPQYKLQRITCCELSAKVNCLGCQTVSCREIRQRVPKQI